MCFQNCLNLLKRKGMQIRRSSYGCNFKCSYFHVSAVLFPREKQCLIRGYDFLQLY